ncbi:thioredoxin-like protein [Schizophyllum commune H4-8]|uniref:thioredoxin-like protein n=1 Tax=Schizophyllum commune (strain H4-8 / FGSC 9210) TaxID=578458 RepID=UPI00215EBE7A|nr:thioredoxin-like protein [Schizophyllum commune H4-8]KAI5899148.1 thioredoxin-like protein [Schizophyllum commune H4-8]
MGTVMEIESTREWKAALKSAKAARMLTFAMFYVPRSKACKVLGPIFSQLASQYENVVFLKVDVTKNRRIEGKYNIDQVPTFIVYRGERLVDGCVKPTRRELLALAARCFSMEPKPATAPLPGAGNTTPVNKGPSPVAANPLHAEAARDEAKTNPASAADPPTLGKPIEIESILQWTTFLTPTTKDEHLVLVQFYSPANRECKSITPTFTQLAAQYPKVTFLRVDATQHPGAAIAKKYKIDTLPFFWLFSGGLPVDGMMGSDARSLRELAARRFSVPDIHNPGVDATIPVDADVAKAQGNAAFAMGDYGQAAAHYTRAVELAPGWAVPRANRAYAHMKLVEGAGTGVSDTGTEEGQRDTGAPKDLRNELRLRAMEDAYVATRLDERWGKGWVRLAQAMLMEAEVEGREGREEGVRKMLEGAQEALYNAVGLSEGRVLKEAQEMMEDVTARLKAL